MVDNFKCPISGLIYNDPVIAQAWTKIPFIMGPEKGLKRLERIPLTI